MKIIEISKKLNNQKNQKKRGKVIMNIYRWDKQKTSSKMGGFNQIMSIITLNVNNLNSPIKG